LYLTVLAALTFLLVVAPVYGGTYSISVRTDLPSYTGGQAIHITGTVTPAPGPNTAAFIQVQNPNHNTVIVGEADVDPSTGAFSFSSFTGATQSWIAGSYSVSATWGGNGVAIMANSSFTYTPTSSTTTTTTSSSSTTTTSSSTNSTSSSTSTTSSAVPEFNSQALLFSVIIALTAVAILGNKMVGLKRVQ
jgi:hypothetical protein